LLGGLLAPGRALAAGVPRVDHIAVVILENRSYDQVRTEPYIASLVASSTSFSSSFAVSHPSHPNYLALWSGSLQGANSNDCPAIGSPFTAENLGHACEAAGLTWRAYVEDLPSAGFTDCTWNGRNYTRSHAPWADFSNVDHANEVPFAELAVAESLDTMPNLAFVIPNKCDSMHDCPVPSGDAWLAAQIPPLVDAVGPNGLVVVTWDEDDDLSSNHILTVFTGPPVKPNYASAQAITHYTVLRTLCDALGLAPFAAAATETPISDIWLGSPGPPIIAMLHPNGPENYAVGTALAFQWAASPGIASIRVELSRTGRTGPWETIFASTPNDGAQSWTVTGSASDSCWARFTDTAGSGATASSAAAFHIAAGSPPQPPPPPSNVTRINFQPALAPVPSDYQPDTGAVFDVARGYGWSSVMLMKARSLLPGDPRDSFVDVVNNQTATWDFVVPNGDYLVSVTCGDPLTTATNRVDLEGQSVLADVFTQGAQFTTRTDMMVTVSDGRLTMTAGGNGQITHTKVDCIAIRSANPPPPPPAGQPPVVAIVSPAADQSVGNATTDFTFYGTASDDDSVAAVEYRVGGGAWQAATGTLTWSFTATGVAVGPNLVEVRARDGTALYSIVESRTITRAAAAAQYTLSVSAAGPGDVWLNPSGGTYASGTVVGLMAAPAPGWSFSGWSGDLSGTANPGSITMNANRSVHAHFRVVSSSVRQATLVDVQAGGSMLTNSVSTAANVVADTSQLYLAAISTTKPNVGVLSVSGLGLDWHVVKAQCSGRGTTGVEVWAAQGIPTASGIVTATLSAVPSAAVLDVSRYSGVDLTNPIGNLVSATSLGLNTGCAGGVDDMTYSFPLPANGGGGLAFAAVALRSRFHSPGSGITERAETLWGSGLSTAGIAVEDAPADAGSSIVLSGSFSSVLDWAAVGFEIATRRLPVPSGVAEHSGRNALRIQVLDSVGAATTVSYDLPRASLVSLAVFDVAGRRVAQLVEGPQASGVHFVRWAAADARGRRMPSGVYFCRLQSPSAAASARLILLK
jgi:acid phosphatase